MEVCKLDMEKGEGRSDGDSSLTCHRAKIKKSGNTHQWCGKTSILSNADGKRWHTHTHKSMGTCPLTHQSETNVLTLTPLSDKKNWIDIKL